MKITKLFPILAAGILALFTVSSCSSSPLYGFKAVSNQGEEVDFSSYKGKVLLIVNTASKCGFTPQYEGLEALYQQFRDKGLVVIGFPCDQFGHQEPGSNDEIAEFCKLNYGVTFPLMDKTEVNGENASPIFKWLYSEKPFESFGDSDRAQFMDRMMSARDPEYASNPDIKWNFTKFLIDRKGQVVAGFFFMFSRIVDRYAARIASLPERTSIWQTFPVRGWVLIVCMSCLGIALKLIPGVPGEFTASFYSGLGPMLVYAACRFVSSEKRLA